MHPVRRAYASPLPRCIENSYCHAKRYSNSGGVTKAVKQALMEQGVNTGVNVRQCNGAAECRKALMLLKAGKSLSIAFTSLAVAAIGETVVEIWPASSGKWRRIKCTNAGQQEVVIFLPSLYASAHSCASESDTKSVCWRLLIT